MRLKMLLDTVMKKLKKEPGRVTTLGLTWAKLQGKLSTGLISILSLADKGMWKIRSAVLEIQSQAKATISLHTIQKIKPAEFKWCSTASGFAGLSGQILSYSNGSGSWIGSGAGGRTPYNSGAGAYYTIGSGLNFSNYNTNNTITFNGHRLWASFGSSRNDLVKCRDIMFKSPLSDAFKSLERKPWVKELRQSSGRLIGKDYVR